MSRIRRTSKGRKERRSPSWLLDIEAIKIIVNHRVFCTNKKVYPSIWRLKTVTSFAAELVIGMGIKQVAFMADTKNDINDMN